MGMMNPKRLSAATCTRVMFCDDFVVVLLTLYAESKKTEVTFRIAELEKGDDRALRSLTGDILNMSGLNSKETNKLTSYASPPP